MCAGVFSDDAVTCNSDILTDCRYAWYADTCGNNAFMHVAFGIQQLKRIHVPIIGINTPTQNGFDATISIDDEDGMFTAAQHLINLGHKNIVYVCSDAVDSINSSIDARGEGFIRACKTSPHGTIGRISARR